VFSSDFAIAVAGDLGGKTGIGQNAAEALDLVLSLGINSDSPVDALEARLQDCRLGQPADLGKCFVISPPVAKWSSRSNYRVTSALAHVRWTNQLELRTENE